MIWFAPASSAFTWATVRSSSPTISGTTTRADEKYGAVKTPIANVTASSAGKVRSTAAVEDRDHDDQRPAGCVGDQHRALGSEPDDHRAGRNPDDHDGQQLGGEDPAHLGGRARRRSTNHGNAMNVIASP